MISRTSLALTMSLTWFVSLGQDASHLGVEDSLEAIWICCLVLSKHAIWLLLSTVPVLSEVHEVEAIIMFEKPEEITEFEWLVLSGCSGGGLRRSRSLGASPATWRRSKKRASACGAEDVLS